LSKDNALNSYSVFEEDGTTPAIGTDYNGITKITVDFDGVKCSIVSLDKIVEDIEARVTDIEDGTTVVEKAKRDQLGNEIDTFYAPLTSLDAKLDKTQRAILGGGVLINSPFTVNQRVVLGTVVLSAGEYGLDRWRAGSGGCTFTFATSLNITTITISAGTLEQEIEGINLQSDDYILSWQGTAAGQIDGGGFAVSPVIETLVGGVNSIVEFGTGTLIIPKLEQGIIATDFISKSFAEEIIDCQRYTYVPENFDDGTHIAMGIARNTTQARVLLTFPTTMRVAPSLVVIPTEWKLFDSSNFTTLTALSINESRKDGCELFSTVASGLTAFRPYFLDSVSANTKIIFVAEL
jgi:hypothetical protein